MTRNTIARWLGVLAVTVTGCRAILGIEDGNPIDACTTCDSGSTDSGRPGPDVAVDEVADVMKNLPRSCRELKSAGINTDGVYAIDLDGPGPKRPLNIYCRNMMTVDPSEYLELPANADAGLPNSNFSGWVTNAPPGVCASEPTRTVWFERVRLNIEVMRIEVTDTTFAHPLTGPYQPIAYALAGSCVNLGDRSGRANVNLVGTPLRIASSTQFGAVGYGAAGDAVFSADRKRVDLSGGGYSGTESVVSDGGLIVEFDP